MSKTVRQVALLSCLGAIAICIATDRAQASSFALREESADGLSTAYAGQTAKAYDSSTVYYNPAGIVWLQNNEISGSTTWISPDIRFTGQNSNPLYSSGIGGPTVQGIDGPNVVKPAAVGSIFVAYRIDPDFSVGFSFAVPFGERAEYKEDWVGRYQALASDLTDYEASLLASYKVTKDFSIGGGPRVDYFTGTLSQALNISAIGVEVANVTNFLASQQAAAGNSAGAKTLKAQAASLQNLALGWAQTGTDGEAKLSGNATGVGYTLSALYVPDSATRLGFTFKSKMFHDLSGSNQIELPASAGSAPSLFTNLFVNQPAKLKVTLPDTLTVGVYHDLDDQWAIMSDVQWTEWSVLKSLNVIGAQTGLISSTPENMRNSWYAALGVNYKPIDRWTLHAGTAYDQSPDTNAIRLARIPDAGRYWLSSGATYQVTRSIDLTLGYAHLFVRNDRITDGSAAALAGGVLTGGYQSSVDIFSSTIAMRF